MEIEGQVLTTCEIAADGSAVLLGFKDSAGIPNLLRLPLDQVGALAMTLPSVIEKALRTRYRDGSLRYTYPLGSWAFEQASDAANYIMTLRTPDGFGVCFSMPRSKSEALSKAMAASPALSAPVPVN